MLTGNFRPLDGCWEKVRRAKEHLAQLEREFTPSPNNDLYKALTEYEGKTGQYIITARISDAAFVRWAVIVGEIVHDLRSALDHLVCAIARRSNTTFDCAGDLAFPIYPWKLRAGERRKELKAISDTEAVAEIERLQPHVAGDGAKQHPMWTLYCLSNRDKHREILLGVLSLMTYANVAAPGQPYVPPVATIRGRQSLQDGTVQLTLTVASPSAVDVQREPRLFVRFDKPASEEPEPFSGLPVLSVLDGCVRIVEDALTRLAQFAA